MSEQRILSQLGLDALGEFFPVEVADQPFELRFVQIVPVSHSGHI